MKKFIRLIAAVFTLTLALAACNTAPEVPEFTDLYLLTELEEIFTEDYGTNTERYPARFNPATGETTTLCADPLCNHGVGSGCPFEGYSPTFELAFGANKVYFEKHYYDNNDGTFREDLMCYDIASASCSTVITEKEIRSRLPEDKQSGLIFLYHSNGYYYIRAHDGGSSTDPVLLHLRLDMTTGETVSLPLDFLNYPSYKYGDKYLYTRGGGSDSFALCIADNPDGENLELLLETDTYTATFGDLLDEDLLLYCTAEKDSEGRYDFKSMTLHTFDLKRRESRILFSDMADVYLAGHGGYIYTTFFEDDPVLLGKNKNSGENIYNNTAGKLWRVNIETGEREVVAEEPDCRLDYGKVNRVGKYITIEYTRTDYENPTEVATERGIFYRYYTERGYLVYDTETGTHAVYKKS